MTRIQQILLATALALPLAANAQHTVERTDTCQATNDYGQCVSQLTTINVTFNIPARDASRPGAFFIGARLTAGTLGDISNINYDTVALYLLTPSGWIQFNGSNYTPFTYFTATPTTQTYNIINNQDICALAGGPTPIELWAGYGVLSQEKEATIATLVQAGTTVPLDHMRSVWVYHDMKDNQKYQIIHITNPCEISPSLNPGGYVDPTQGGGG